MAISRRLEEELGVLERFPLCQKIVASLLADNEPMVLLEGLAGTGKTTCAKIIASRFGSFFDSGVFWVDPDLGSLADQLDEIGRRTVRRTLIVVDRVDEWSTEKRTFSAIASRLAPNEHPFQFLVAGRDLRFFRKLKPPYFRLADDQIGNIEQVRLHLSMMGNGPAAHLFDNMPLDTHEAYERVPRYTSSGIGIDGFDSKDIPGFSLRAILIPQRRVPDGVLVKLIDPVYSELLRAIRKNPGLIHELDPRKWEEIIAAAYDREGFDEVILTPRSGDLGRDVIAIKKGHGSVRFLEQVKAYRPGNLVKADEVRALLGVLSAEPNASKAIFSTTSHFAPRLATDPLIKPFLPHRLELVDRESLLTRLKVNDP